MGAGILLLTIGVAGTGWGARYLFNVRGAADKIAARRNAVRAVTAARTMNLALTEPSRFGPWFFRITAGVTMASSLLLAFAGLALTFAG
ncbi:hypothetical protein P1P75_35475 [Streptomyces sp. ID05-39B]|uniref:hypothetical protein n=1 Tax=Streptomyces sp. ID05-39B TaxID=3028664 RepID=UPI0029B88393|nr:hypothetical protein [Streptomyces sp. ID05-39B]MDX3531558.1 hypothetical protein [Streptomyces sp. ID05-39B]